MAEPREPTDVAAPGAPGALGALAPIRARKLTEAADLHCGRVAMWAKAELLPPARNLELALTGGGVIAEMKRRSPSGGELRPGLDPVALAVGYQAAGAAAISVLTDRVGFGGSLGDLGAVAGAVGIPVLRKDFVVDPVQIAETRIAGADVVLLIVALLPGRAQLEDAISAARRAGMSAIVEVHDAGETRTALEAGATCIGINNRDLRSLRSDLATFSALRPLISDDVVCIAESGIRTTDDVRRLRAQGADAILVGETLMRAPDPATLCAEFVEAMTA